MALRFKRNFVIELLFPLPCHIATDYPLVSLTSLLLCVSRCLKLGESSTIQFCFGPVHRLFSTPHYGSSVDSDYYSRITKPFDYSIEVQARGLAASSHKVECTGNANSGVPFLRALLLTVDAMSQCPPTICPLIAAFNLDSHSSSLFETGPMPKLLRVKCITVAQHGWLKDRIASSAIQYVWKEQE